MNLEWLGDSTLVAHDIPCARWPAAADYAAALRLARPEVVVEIVCAFDSVAICCDLSKLLQRGPRSLRDWAVGVFERGDAKDVTAEPRRFEIPVRYDEQAGPDLRALARQLHLSVEEIIHRHQSAEYRVLAVGFMPGFAYLAGLPAELQAPRRSSPRTRVEPGSVGIGGPYTGVYPFASPGGWNIIGRTALTIFDPSTPQGSLLRVGDTVFFRRVRE